MMMSDPSTNTTLFNSTFVPRRPPPWIITMSESYRISFMVCYSLILVLSVLGNTSIIAIVARNPSMRSTINYLIANMAASDLASSLVVTGLFFSVTHNLSKEWKVPGVLGNILCKLCPYIRDTSIAISIHSMVAIAFDRFFAVVFPMRPTPRLLDLRILLPIIWCISLGTFTVHLVNYKLVSPIEGIDICIGIWASGAVDTIKAHAFFYLSIFTAFWVTPLTTIAILYTIIALKMRRQTLPGQQSSQAEEVRRTRNKNVAKLAFAIVFFFFCCWFPVHVFNIMDLSVWKGNIPNDMDPRLFVILQDTIFMISYLSFVINPYICLTFSSKFRKCLRNLFPFSLCFSTKIHDPVGVPARPHRHPDIE